MNSLSSDIVADVLLRLHQEADVIDGWLVPSDASEAPAPEFMITPFLEAETRDLKAPYHGFAANFLSVSAQFGRFFYVCARGCNAKRIVEFGLSMGVSAIYMAAALRDIGGGCLIGTDLEPPKGERAQANGIAAGLGDLVEFHVGDARETLKSEVGGNIDLVMLDGAFTLYLPILKLLEPHLQPDALIIGENAFEEAPGYIDYVRALQNGYFSSPLPSIQTAANEFTVKTK